MSSINLENHGEKGGENGGCMLDLESLTRPQLMCVARSLRLHVSGKKQELVQRILELLSVYEDEEQIDLLKNALEEALEEAKEQGEKGTNDEGQGADEEEKKEAGEGAAPEKEAKEGDESEPSMEVEEEEGGGDDDDYNDPDYHEYEDDNYEEENDNEDGEGGNDNDDDEDEEYEEPTHIRRQTRSMTQRHSPRFICGECGQQCSSATALSTHMMVHSKSLKCNFPHCNLTFARRGDLKRHVQTIHRGTRLVLFGFLAVPL